MKLVDKWIEWEKANKLTAYMVVEDLQKFLTSKQASGKPDGPTECSDCWTCKYKKKTEELLTELSSAPKQAKPKVDSSSSKELTEEMKK